MANFTNRDLRKIEGAVEQILDDIKHGPCTSEGIRAIDAGYPLFINLQYNLYNQELFEAVAAHINAAGYAIEGCYNGDTRCTGQLCAIARKL